MCEAGRIRHHLKHNLWREECTVLFVGYQAEGTLGSALTGGAEEVSLFNEKIQVRANIEQMRGISGHADRDMLLGWLENISPKPKNVFVNHGNDGVCDSFAALITDTLSIPACAPYSGDEFDLIANTQTVKAEVKKSVKKPKKTNAVYDRLVAAGKRLMAVIEQNSRLANGEMIKFTDRINSLCDKYKN